MKKSEVYYAAQLIVISSFISPAEKLEILRVLMEDEKLEKYGEAREEKEKAVDTE